MKSIKVSIRQRIIAVLLALLLLAISLVVGIVRINLAKDHITASETLSTIAYSAEVAHYKWSSNLSSALFTGSEFTGSTADDSCVLGKWIYGESGTADTVILELLQQIKPLHKTIHESASYALSLSETNLDSGQNYYKNTITDNITTLVGMLDQIVTRSNDLITESNEDMTRSILVISGLSAVCLAIVLVSLANLSTFVMRKIAEPLVAITNKSQSLSKGELNYSVTITDNDELGQLDSALQTSVTAISGYIQEIDSAMQQLSAGNFNIFFGREFIGDFQSIQQAIDRFATDFSTAFRKIDHSSGALSLHADQIASASQSLSQGATEQASSVEELSSTIRSISQRIQQNAEDTHSANQQAMFVGTEMESLNKKMEELTAAMADINAASGEIEKIIKTIQDIAFQTNILALNASVESARAGDAGKGFAVVAEEVRNLAKKSSDAAKTSESLIQRSLAAVENGASIASITAGSLKEAVKNTSQVTGLMEKISISSTEQAKAIAQGTLGIEQISAAIHTTSAAAEESAATSQELTAQAQLLKSLTGKIQLKE